jgi:pheromone a factor receptor
MTAITTTSTVDPTYPAFPIVTSFGILLLLLPLYWHWKSRNVGTLLYIGWGLTGNIIYLVNSVVWSGNLRNDHHFWCDLSTKLMIGLSVAFPATSLVINRRLYTIATIRQVNVSRSESRKNAIIEVCLGLGIPILVMALHVVVQGHRYDIIENVGCWPSTYVTPMTIPLVFMWPILISMVSLVYASLSFRAFLNQRKEFNAILQSGNSGLNVNRYFRLMALAATEIVLSLPLCIYILVENLSTGLHPWISWANTHYDFNRTEFVPFGIFALYPSAWVLTNISRYTNPAAGFFFFTYLGMAGESGLFYKKIFWSLMRLCGIASPLECSQGASWVARPGASAPDHMRSIPPFNTTASLASSTAKKPTSSLDLYAVSSSRMQANSSSDSLSLPPDLADNFEAALPSYVNEADVPAAATSTALQSSRPSTPTTAGPAEVAKDVV